MMLEKAITPPADYPGVKAAMDAFEHRNGRPNANALAHVPARVDLVYFIQRDLDGCIKIGHSADVWTRLSGIRTYVGAAKLLACQPGGLAMEKRLHLLFKDDRIHGEWFAPSDRLLAHIAALNA